MPRLHLALLSVVLGLAACRWSSAPERQPESTKAIGISALDRILRPGSEPLPKTFRGIVDRVLERTRGSENPMLIPFGRSLVRGMTDLADPRIVVSIRTADPERLGAGETLANYGGLFLAYARKAGLVEAISYNETAGRFEFELIEGVGVDGETPRLVQADRALCLACHKLGTPIFPVGIWSETLDHNVELLRRARAAMRDRRGLRYLGFEVPEEAVEQFIPPGQDFEEAVTTSARRLVANDLWRRIAKGVPRARVDIVRFGLIDRGNFWQEIAGYVDWPPYVESRRGLIALIRKRNRGEISWPAPTLPDRNPLTHPAIDGPHDPLHAKFGIAGILRDDSTLGMVRSYLTNELFTDDDGRRFRRYLEKRRAGRSLGDTVLAITAPWERQAWATADEPAQRCRILSAAMPEEKHPGCGPDDERWRAPRPSATIASDPQLAPFAKTCASCHRPGGARPDFLASPAAFRSWARCIAVAMDWERKPKREMPPADSAQHAALETRPALRRRLLDRAMRAAEEARIAHQAKLAPAPAKCL